MPNPETPTPVDFDQWAELARRDPVTFEVQRAQIIAATIRQAPVRMQRRLHSLQWKIDRIRDTSGTPMAACLRINRLMWDSVTGTDGLLTRLQQPASPPPARRSARILPFPG